VIRLAILAAALAAGAADVDETQFRYARSLVAPSGDPVRFEPDGAMYGHASPGFPDLRILDADGEQVPWRPQPVPARVPSELVAVVARGRRDGTVSVVIDRGPVRPVIDRIALQIPDRVFVGEVTVQGSNTGAEGSYGTLSTTPIYSVRGAVAARSTTAVLPPTDYRFLLIQARGVSDVTGAAVERDPSRPPLEPVDARSTRSNRSRTTMVKLDLGHGRVPVDEVRIRSSSPRYVRQVTVEGSNDGTTFNSLSTGQIARFPGVELSSISLASAHRFIRVTIQNGDDVPLEGLEVTAHAKPRRLLLSEGYEPPFRLLYGGASVPAPAYDFARLPVAATGFESAREGILGAEAANELFEPPGDTRTFFERNDYVIEVLLVVATVVVAAGGVLALRRRTSAPDT
jgi:hypothetical protein